MTPEERQQLIQEIAEAINPPVVLSYDEQKWVKMAIKREADREAMRQAVIEKTFTGLLWAILIGMGTAFMEYLRAHGWK